MTTLGVLAYGPTTLGYPFHKLFTTTAHIAAPADLVKEKVQAVVLWGGEDISPFLYGQKASRQFCDAGDTPSKRDLVEWGVMKEAVKLGIPIIGVCRGAQLMCAFDGGTLAQDVSGHGQHHGILTCDNFSFVAPGDHHQMMLPRAEGNQTLAWSDVRRAQFYIGENNTISPLSPTFKEPEAIYFKDIRGMAFQYHPEWAAAESACVKWTLDMVKEMFL